MKGDQIGSMPDFARETRDGWGFFSTFKRIVKQDRWVLGVIELFARTCELLFAHRVNNTDEASVRFSSLSFGKMCLAVCFATAVIGGIAPHARPICHLTLRERRGPRKIRSQIPEFRGSRLKSRTQASI
jgi:hypothetical protein